MLKTGTNPTTDREQFTRSNAPTARLPTSVRLTEHKRAKRNGETNDQIAVRHQLTNHSIDWDSVQCLDCSTDYSMTDFGKH